MMYDINVKKLKSILITERSLSLARVSKNCGVASGYISKTSENGRMSDKVIYALMDKYEINPSRYVIGWKGGKK